MISYIMFVILMVVIWFKGSPSDSLAVALAGIVLFQLVTLKQYIEKRFKELDK